MHFLNIRFVERLKTESVWCGQVLGFLYAGHVASVKLNGGVYALPMDSGPMAWFYNKDVFDKAVDPTRVRTWDEFYDAAKKVRATVLHYVRFW